MKGIEDLTDSNDSPAGAIPTGEQVEQVKNPEAVLKKNSELLAKNKSLSEKVKTYETAELERSALIKATEEKEKAENGQAVEILKSKDNEISKLKKEIESNNAIAKEFSDKVSKDLNARREILLKDFPESEQELWKNADLPLLELQHLKLNVNIRPSKISGNMQSQETMPKFMTHRERINYHYTSKGK